MNNSLILTLRRNFTQALNTNNFKETKLILDELKKLDPVSKQTRGLELEYLIKIKKISEAETLSSSLYSQYPSSSRILFLTGQVKYYLKDYISAEKLFSESNKIYKHHKTLHWLGKTLTHIGKLDKAERILSKLASLHPHICIDLGWLYERKKDFQNAIKQYELFLKKYPANDYVKTQLKKLRAKLVNADELLDQVNSITDVGGEISIELVPVIIEKMICKANLSEIKETIDKYKDKLKSKEGVETAWLLYRAKHFDLAFELFFINLENNISQYKFLNTLESSAGKCLRLEELSKKYESLALEHKKLYGRIKKISMKLKTNIPRGN